MQYRIGIVNSFFCKRDKKSGCFMRIDAILASYNALL